MKLFGKGETDVKANKTAKAVLFAKFVVFDVVGNKGLARSDSDGAASVCASVT